MPVSRRRRSPGESRSVALVGHEDHHVGETTLWLVLLALGNSLLGLPIAETLGLDSDTARDIAARRLRAQIEAAHPHG